MICFRDRTYCSQSAEMKGLCINTSCDRLFTKADSAAAKQWWGNDGAPVALMNYKSDTCGYKEEKSED